ncbi:MAG TPA: GldG family protein [Verrucomicrobiae bacterium]|nr:GldG family protein [Verrucomicrobiae bacterium]
MPVRTESTPSFSPGRKWGIGLNVALLIVLVTAVVVMVNYIGQVYFLRLHWAGATREPLSRQTLALLNSLTNHVKIIVYYDKDDPIYSMVADLANEYRLANRRISVQLLDYKRDPAAALQLRMKYPFLSSPEAKNLVIFDSDGRVKPIEGNALAKYILEKVPNPDEPFRRKLTAFQGEMTFDGTLMAITSPKKLQAYFLEGEGEPQIDGHDEQFGYNKFASILRLNYVEPHELSLLGTNNVPQDCNLLVIAGPTERFSDITLERIDQYLNQGGRLLALFSYRTIHRQTGLESILAKWGVQVGDSIIKDPDHTTQHDLVDIKVGSFNPKHPLVEPLQLQQLHFVLPRAIGDLPPQTPDPPHVDKLAFSGPNSFAVDAPSVLKAFPLMVAVEKGAINGVVTERGTTRMVVIGDSNCLGNEMIESAANRDFANYLVNWLLDRTQLIKGPGPRPVTEYKLTMTRTQLQSAEWILLAGMPGTAVAFGWLVWLRRRH